MTLRLRQRFVAVVDDPAMQVTTLASLARPLAIEMSALLRLAGKSVPHEDRTALIFQAATAAFEVDGEALALLAALRQGEAVRDDLQPLFTSVLKTLDRLTARAEQMMETP